ncbi:hypothetical protein CERSUDRAFT_100974, partial [Gelatoporia subvermispora B]
MSEAPGEPLYWGHLGGEDMYPCGFGYWEGSRYEDWYFPSTNLNAEISYYPDNDPTAQFSLPGSSYLRFFPDNNLSSSEAVRNLPVISRVDTPIPHSEPTLTSQLVEALQAVCTAFESGLGSPIPPRFHPEPSTEGFNLLLSAFLHTIRTLSVHHPVVGLLAIEAAKIKPEDWSSESAYLLADPSASPLDKLGDAFLAAREVLPDTHPVLSYLADEIILVMSPAERELLAANGYVFHPETQLAHELWRDPELYFDMAIDTDGAGYERAPELTSRNDPDVYPNSTPPPDVAMRDDEPTRREGIGADVCAPEPMDVDTAAIAPSAQRAIGTTDADVERVPDSNPDSNSDNSAYGANVERETRASTAALAPDALAATAP